MSRRGWEADYVHSAADRVSRRWLYSGAQLHSRHSTIAVRILFGIFLSLSVSLGADASEETSSATPIVCVRDTDKDPGQIRDLFNKIDHMAVDELQRMPVLFYLSPGNLSMSDVVRLFNFHNGREDGKPLEVTGIRRLDFSEAPAFKAAYVVRTTRSMWFNRGSETRSSYNDLSAYWLVSFQGCDVRIVREAPELSYFVND
jgi:hypothetical protein